MIKAQQETPAACSFPSWFLLHAVSIWFDGIISTAALCFYFTGRIISSCQGLGEIQLTEGFLSWWLPDVLRSVLLRFYCLSAASLIIFISLLLTCYIFSKPTQVIVTTEHCLDCSECQSLPSHRDSGWNSASECISGLVDKPPATAWSRQRKEDSSSKQVWLWSKLSLFKTKWNKQTKTHK